MDTLPPDRLPDDQMFLVNDHASPTAKAMEVAGMKGTKGAKRTPNEAVLVVFKPRSRALPALPIEIATTFRSAAMMPTRCAESIRPYHKLRTAGGRA